MGKRCLGRTEGERHATYIRGRPRIGSEDISEGWCQKFLPTFDGAAALADLLALAFEPTSFNKVSLGRGIK